MKALNSDLSHNHFIYLHYSNLNRQELAVKYIERGFIPNENFPEALARFNELQKPQIAVHLKNWKTFLFPTILMSMYYYVKIYIPQKRKKLNRKIEGKDLIEIDKWENSFKKDLPVPRGYSYFTIFQLERQKREEVGEEELTFTQGNWKDTKVKLQKDSNLQLQKFIEQQSKNPKNSQDIYQFKLLRDKSQNKQQIN